MHPIGLLIFDLDGTLVDTLDDIAASLNHTLLLLGRQALGRDQVRQLIGDGVRTLLLRALNGNETRLPEALTLYKEHHRRNQTAHSKLYPGVHETLEHFKGLPLALISNKSSAFIGPLLESLGIDRYFVSVIGADQGLPLKPAPDALLSVMAERGVLKERTVMVGDGTTDMEAGKAAGVITCAAAYGFRSEPELLQCGPDHIIHDIRELKELFVSEAL
jgi:phosphoglycolate phosphatase